MKQLQRHKIMTGRDNKPTKRQKMAKKKGTKRPERVSTTQREVV